MENTKAGNNEETKTIINGGNPFADGNNSSVTNTAAAVVVQNEQEGESNNMAVVNNPSNNQRTRTSFTNLSQVDADLALARTLQEQERAYMMLRMNGDGSGYGSWEAGSYAHEDDDEFGHLSEEEDDGTDMDDVGGEDIDDDDDDDNDEDAFDVHAHTEDEEDNNPRVELDPSAFPNDEAYARALQDAEEREMAARLLSLAGINEREVEDTDSEDHGVNSQDAWDNVDPDELSYEELLALGEVIGTESRGLSADTIASLPSINYKSQSTQEGTIDSCVICRLDYEEDDSLTELTCKHLYHTECINNWLRINKVCPICNAEVSISESS